MVQGVRTPPPLKFEKCPFHLYIFLNLFKKFHVIVLFLSWTLPPPISEKVDPPGGGGGGGGGAYISLCVGRDARRNPVMLIVSDGVWSLPINGSIDYLP